MAIYWIRVAFFLLSKEVVYCSDLQAPDTETAGMVNPGNRDKANPAGQTKLTS